MSIQYEQASVVLICGQHFQMTSSEADSVYVSFSACLYEVQKSYCCHTGIGVCLGVCVWINGCFGLSFLKTCISLLMDGFRCYSTDVR